MDAWPVWNYTEGQSIRVVCYTNAAKAKLLLNGELAGDEKAYDAETGIIVWDIPYRAGKLEVVGMDKAGNKLAISGIQTSSRPYALKVTTVNSVISKDDGVAHVVVEVVDEKGIPVMLSDDEVTCQIAGPARLLGLEASNNKDMSDYTDHKHRVFHGRILAYIQAKGESGKVKVRFSAPWLKPAEISIDIK